MHSSSPLASQRDLPISLSLLVNCFSQDGLDNSGWVRIRSRILNDLNTVVCEGKFSGYSPLLILAANSQGRQLLKDDEDLRGQITSRGLNATIAEGEYKGRSALYFLACHPEGRQLLVDDEILQAKITDVGLNAIVSYEQCNDKSALWFLAVSPCGRQLLKADAELRSKITTEGLNAVAAKGEYKGESVLSFLACFDEGRQLLLDDSHLRNKITTEGLNAVISEGEDKGKSALFYLAAASPEGRQLLKDDKELRGKISVKGLNTVVPEGRDKGSSVLLMLASSIVGQQLLKDDADLRSKITTQGLNAVLAQGTSQGCSALYCLASFPEGRQLLVDDEVLRGKITAEGLNAVLVEGEDKGVSALWYIASSPDGWLLLSDQKSLHENISITALVSTFLHDNNTGSVQRYSVLAHILEDKNKHTILFDNVRLMGEITERVTSCLSSYEVSSQEVIDQSNGDYIIKLLLENTPERFIDILSSTRISSDAIMTYLSGHVGLVCSLAKSTDGHIITRETVLEFGQDSDGIMVLDDAKKQEIKELLRTWLQANIREKFLDILKEQNGIDFLLSFSDTVGNLDASVLQQSIVVDENTLTVEEYLQRSANGRELYHAIMSSLEQGLSISSLSLFEGDVDDNPSQSNYPT